VRVEGTQAVEEGRLVRAVEGARVDLVADPGFVDLVSLTTPRVVTVSVPSLVVMSKRPWPR